MTIYSYLPVLLPILILIGMIISILFARGKNIIEIKISKLKSDDVKIKVLNFFAKNNFRYTEQENNIIGVKGSKWILGQRTFNIKLSNSTEGCNLYGEFYLNSAGIKMKFAKLSWMAGLGRRDGWKLMNAFISEISENFNQKTESSKNVLIVIGILFILVLLIGAGIYLWVYTLIPPGKQTPEITAACERYSNDYVIVMDSERGASVKSLKYSITDNQILVEDYSNYSGSNGLSANYVDEIYGADLTFQNEEGNPVTNVSFYDNDLDGGVSTGDFFVIRGINNNDIYNDKGERVPGIGRDGLVFNLKFTPTNETICSITLSDTSPITNKTIPKISNRFTINHTTVPKTRNLNISTSKPVSSSSPSLHGNTVMIAVTVCNNDSMNVSNISVRFLDDGKEFYSEEKISIEAEDDLRVLTSTYYLEETKTHNITVEMMIPEWDIPIQAKASVIVVPSPPIATTSFEVNPFAVLFTVLIASLLSAILRKRKVSYQPTKQQHS